MTEYHLHHEPSNTGTIQELLSWFGKYWFQLVIAFFICHLYASREVQFPDGLTANGRAVKTSHQAEMVPAAFVDLATAPVEKATKIPAKPVKNWKSNDFKNLSFVLSPDMAEKKGVDAGIVKEKLKNCRSYVERFAATAISEQKQFGIPASITLAQGLIETDAGSSKLATDSNNHFGIKCRSKCRHCTCRNYVDDDVYDMFRVFETSWESFREHSKLLQIDRYSHLKKLGTADYAGWARGLKKAGYATDKNYDKKLIQIIEELDLHQFD